MLAVHIKATFRLPESIVTHYLEDLTDAELLVRPLDNMNHIAWQLGHLIASENFHISQISPSRMPALPAGFSERHTQVTAGSNDPADFYPKADYLHWMKQQRLGTYAVLEELSDEALEQEAPKSIRYFGATVGAVIAGESTHWMMHAGQWAVVRRKLGKPPLF